MRRACQAAAVAAALAGAAGCASGPGNYGVGKTRKCLAKDGFRFRKLSATSDFVASSASGGAIALRLPGNAVTLAFGKDSQEASALASGYRRGGAFATIETDRNVVVVWTTPPPANEAQRVRGCLA